MLSYSHGTSSTPLLGQTIGDDLELPWPGSASARRWCARTRTCG